MSAGAVAEARRQIRAITAAYFEAMDSGDFSTLTTVFRDGRVRAPIGVDGVTVSPARPDPYDWRDQALAMFRDAVRLYDGVPCTCHFTTNLRIAVDSDLRTATAVSRFTVLQARPSLPLQPIVTGRYIDTFELRQERWCLVDRFEDSMLWGNVREHLSDAALAGLAVPFRAATTARTSLL